MFGTRSGRAGGARVAPPPAALWRRHPGDSGPVAAPPANDVLAADSPAPGSNAGSNAVAGTSVRSLGAGRSAYVVVALWHSKGTLVYRGGSPRERYLPRDSPGRTRDRSSRGALIQNRESRTKEGPSIFARRNKTGKETVLEKARKKQTIKNSPAAAVGWRSEDARHWSCFAARCQCPSHCRRVGRPGRGVALDSWRKRWKTKVCVQGIQPKSFVPKTTDSQHHRLGYSPNPILKHAGAFAASTSFVGRRHHLCAVVRWRFQLLGGSDGQVLAEHRGMGIGGDDDRRSRHAGCLADGDSRRTAPRNSLVQSHGTAAANDNKLRLPRRRWCAGAGMLQSTGRADNVYDNAFMESSFGTFKTELEMTEYEKPSEPHIGSWPLYIDYFHRKERKHSAPRLPHSEPIRTPWN